MNKIINPKATFYEENDSMYMKLEFDSVHKNEKFHYSIPKIDLQGFSIDIDKSKLYHGVNLISDYKSAELKFKLFKADGAYYSVQDLTPKEITIEEIEKKLGYKVKIIG